METDWRAEIGKFREWEKGQYQEEIEWEAEYPNWETLYGSVIRSLRECDPHAWDLEEAEELRYILWHYWSFETPKIYTS